MHQSRHEKIQSFLSKLENLESKKKRIEGKEESFEKQEIFTDSTELDKHKATSTSSITITIQEKSLPTIKSSPVKNAEKEKTMPKRTIRTEKDLERIQGTYSLIKILNLHNRNGPS